MKILGLTLDKLIFLAEQGVRLLIERCDVKQGYGYLTVLDCTGHAEILINCRVNIFQTDKEAGKYLEMSQEQAWRLCKIQSDHTSFQSRDPDNNKFGGAIKIGYIILSFAGLPEIDNEALVIYVAYHAGIITKNEALELAISVSHNEHLCEIL